MKWIQNTPIHRNTPILHIYIYLASKNLNLITDSILQLLVMHQDMGRKAAFGPYPKAVQSSSHLHDMFLQHEL
jgi:hypothetical protein